MFKFTVTLALLGLLSSSSYAQNLLKNGNFEKGVEDWSIFIAKEGMAPRSIEISRDYARYGLADNYAGLAFVELDAQSAIQQTIVTQAQKEYVLAFGYSHRRNAGDKQLIIQVNGKTVHSHTVKNSHEEGKFVHKHITFTADAPESKIVIYAVSISGDETKGILLSDVFCNLETEIDLKLFDKI